MQLRVGRPSRSQRPLTADLGVLRAVEAFEMREVMKPTTLRLARPCSLAWEQLSGEGDGRHCEECKTIVHDLDALGPRALRLLIHEHPNGFCGKYTSRPGDSFVIPDEPLRVRPRRQMARAAVVLATSLAACSPEAPPNKGPQGLGSTPPAAYPSPTPVPCSSPAPKGVGTSPAATASLAPLTREACQ